MSTELDTNIEILTDGPLVDAIQRNVIERDLNSEYGGENVIEEVFITDGDQIVSSSDLLRGVLKKGFWDVSDLDKNGEEEFNVDRPSTVDNKVEVRKTLDGTNQSQIEINRGVNLITKIVDPPYPPELMAAFIEVDETNFRCIKTKTIDSVGREYTLESVKFPDGSPYDPSELTDDIQEQVDRDVSIVRDFIEDCNDIMGFEGVLERAAMDHEGIGWAAIEVIRSKDMKIRKLAHIPATRVRVLMGWEGFVEFTGFNKLIYYQPFGAKVVSRKQTFPISKKPEPYNPRFDGDLKPGNAEWNLVDKTTNQRTTDWDLAANEILWIPKHHSNTIYYGMSDVLPALGQVLGNVNIRDYMLQFFEHNTVPRYAIIIEGAKLAPEVKNAIVEYFSTHVKGKHHKTLIIPIPSMRGEVKVRFEKLASDTQEASFQDTRKNNAQSIMTAHGVSPAIIGVHDNASLGSGKGLSQAEIYKDRIITPSQRRWGKTLTNLFRLGLGVRSVALKFNPLDIRDIQAEMEVNKGYLQTGCTTINKVIKQVGLGDPVEGGDRPFILSTNGNLTFVDELTTANSAEKQNLIDQVESLGQQLAVNKQQVKMNGNNGSGGGAASGSSNGSGGVNKIPGKNDKKNFPQGTNSVGKK